MDFENIKIGLTIADWIMIFAVFLGPISAVTIQRFIDKKNNDLHRKMELFKSLMSTRSYNLSYQHVSSLNMVGLEFSGKKYKKVIAAWKLYLDHLSVKEDPEDRNDNSKLRMWVDKKNTLLVDLLYEMSESLGFEIDKVHIGNDGYSPKAHVELENEHNLIRKGIIDILNGEKKIPIEINIPMNDNLLNMLKKNDELFTLLLEHYNGERAINVKIKSDKDENNK